jgi:hypothetical protein
MACGMWRAMAQATRLHRGDLLRAGIDPAGPIRQEPAALREAYRLGRTLVRQARHDAA